MLSAHLSCFAYSNVAAGACLIGAGLNRALQERQALVFIRYRRPNHSGKTALGKEADPFGSELKRSKITAGAAQFVA